MDTKPIDFTEEELKSSENLVNCKKVETGYNVFFKWTVPNYDLIINTRKNTLLYVFRKCHIV